MNKSFKLISNFFKKFYKNEFEISINKINLKKCQGYCALKNNKFFIKISKHLSEEHSIDVLLHELAHVITWNKEIKKHGKIWSIAYGKIYQIYLKEFHNDLDN